MARKFEPIRRESRDVTATTARDIAYELFKRPEQQRFRLPLVSVLIPRGGIFRALDNDNPIPLDRRDRIMSKRSDHCFVKCRFSGNFCRARRRSRDRLSTFLT